MLYHNVAFNIIEIKVRWIFVQISDEDNHIIIDNSNLLGCDAPKILLVNLLKMKDKNYDTCWLCWHGESNSYIWHLEKNEDILTFDIWNGISSFGLPYEGEESKKARPLCRQRHGKRSMPN